jgi:hypothetical protein
MSQSDDRRAAAATPTTSTLLPEDAHLMELLFMEWSAKAREVLVGSAPPPAAVLQLVPKRPRPRRLAALPKPKAIRVANTLGDRLQLMARIDPRKLQKIEREVDRWWRLLASALLFLWAC